MTALTPEWLRLFKPARAARHLGMCLFTFFAVGPLGLAQREPDWPNSHAKVAGLLGYTLSPDTRTILGTGSHSGEVLLRLPSVSRQGVAELAGMLQQGADIEVFMVWQSPGIPQGFENHIEIFRGRPGTEAALVHDFTLLGGPGGRVSFFQPPDARDSPKVLIDIYAGTTYWTTYLLAPDRQSVEKLFDASGYEFTDLDGDGVYELIVSDGRWSDANWCIDLFGFSFYPRIFVRDGVGYQMAWPLPGEANFRVAAVHDLRGDGAAELIVLQDRVGAGQPTTPAVALYRLDQKVFRLVAQASLPADRIAFTEIGFRDSSDGKDILVRTASPATVVQPPDTLARAHDKSELAQCDPQGPGTTGAAYILRADRLEPVQQRER
jgi:hypothetical protein